MCLTRLLINLRSLGHPEVAWDGGADGGGGSVVSGPWSVFLSLCPVRCLWMGEEEEEQQQQEEQQQEEEQEEEEQQEQEQQQAQQ